MMSYTNTKLGRRRRRLAESDYYRRRDDRYWARAKSMQRTFRARRRLPAVGEIVSLSHLLHVFNWMRRCAGQTPGVDGIGYQDVGRREAIDIFRDVAARIADRTYRPDPLRSIRIPKASGGWRTLRLATFRDRVVATAIQRVIDPALETIFLANSHGFRIDRSAWTMLAMLEVMMIRHRQPIIVNSDIRGAFDHVPIAAVTNHLYEILGAPALVDLIDTILRGHDREEVGIAQGNPLSPSALNVIAHYAHDLVIRDHTPFWWRYADNLGVACRNVSEGHDHHARTQMALSEVGLSLKGTADEDTIDLRQSPTRLLGYELSIRDGRMRYAMDAEAWQSLEDNLLQAHQSTNPTKAAQAVIRGWVEWCGPTFANRRAALPDRIHLIAKRHGYRETAPPELIGEWWEASWRRWQIDRRAAQSSMTPCRCR